MTGTHPADTAPRAFRKKPVEIEAVQFDSTNGGPVAKWCGGRNRIESKPSDPTDVAEWIDIPTLEGTMRANVGDWIIRGVQGEFYPCKPDIFAATYEPAGTLPAVVQPEATPDTDDEIPAAVTEAAEQRVADMIREGVAKDLTWHGIAFEVMRFLGARRSAGEA